jgi:CheY-like chemotaxis protein
MRIVCLDGGTTMPAAIATVLVVDDDSLVREAARIILENNGYSVREAPEGEAALASLAASRADIVLLDILMPRKEGLETLIELKQHYPDVTVYAMSASGARKGHDFLSIAAKFGAHGILPKPFTPEELLSLVRSHPVPRRSVTAGVSAGT